MRPGRPPTSASSCRSTPARPRRTWRSRSAASRRRRSRLVRVVIVQDGDLTSEHVDVIKRGRPCACPRFRSVRPGAVGLVGAPWAAGLAATDPTWIARMDADDVAEPDRLDRQLRATSCADTDVIGSAMVEFDVDPERLGLGPLRCPSTTTTSSRR